MPYADGSKVSFGKTFSAVPVILVNAYDATTGKPLIAGVRNESGFAPDKTGFYVKIHNYPSDLVPGGIPVSSGATVQWVAIIPQSSALVAVQARYDSSSYNDGDYIAFDNSFSQSPKVICSAYYSNGSTAYPIMAAPYNITANGFTISLRDADGERSTANVNFIALVPPSNYNYYKEVSMVSDYKMYNNNGSVLFDLTRNADAVLCSAQKDNSAYAVAARNNSRYGFDLGILNYDCAAGTNVWTSWLALGFK